MPDMTNERIEKGLATLRQNPNLILHGGSGENTILIRVRAGKLQTACVPTSTLKSSPDSETVDMGLVRQHSTYVDVKDWSAQAVRSALEAETV